MDRWLFDDEFTFEGKIAWATLLILIFLVPLTFAIPSSSGAPFTADLFDTPKVWLLRVGVMILLAAWGSDLALNGGKIRYQKAVLALYGVLALIFIASTLTSIETVQSFLGKYRRYDGSWSFILYGFLMWVTMQYATSAHRVKQLMQALSISSILVALYGLMQALGWELFSWGTIMFEPNRSFSTYGNPNLLAGFLAFGIFFNLGLALSERSVPAKCFYWVATLLNIVVAVTAFSRSVWVASLVGAVIFTLLILHLRPKLDSLDYIFSGSTLLAASIFVIRSLASPSNVMNFASRVSSITDFSSGSAATRFQIWGAAWRAIMERPLLGWGPDTFRMVFRLFQPPEYNHDAGYRSVADNAHNYPLQVAAGIGLVGAILLYVLQFLFLGLGIRYCWKNLEFDEEEHKKAKKKQAKAQREAHITFRMLYAGVLVAAITYCVHLFFGISVPGCTFLLWIAFGIILAPLAQVRSIEPLTRQKAYAVCAALVLVAILFSTYASVLLWADHYYVKAQMEEQIGNIEQALTYVSTSARLSPRNDQYAIRKAEYTIEAASQGIVEVDEARRVVDDLAADFPNEYDVQLVVLWAYRAFSQFDPAAIDQAIGIAQEAINSYPEGLALRFAYAQLLVDAGRTDEALEQLEFSASSDPGFSEARELIQEIQSRR
ncbi:MAG: O-antigen ligase family protein [Actinomycetia bacterium]|nr:O-antigen ligase family protein [Actinomycetes bacterium]